MTYTFYIQSDNIQNTAKDKARMQKIAKAFRNKGHKAKICGNPSSSGHSYPNKWGCTGKNDVWVCVVGGVCPGTIADMTGYKGFGTYFKKTRLKNAKLMFIFVQTPEGAIKANISDKFYGEAPDDNFSPSGFKGISKLKTYLTSHGVSYLEGTTNTIVSAINNGVCKGASFTFTTTSTSSSSSSSTTLDESESGDYTYGFDKDEPFAAYLEIGYIVRDKDGNKGSLKKMTIDWSAEAPDTSYKWSNSVNGEDVSIVWLNNTKRNSEIEILSKIQAIEGKYTDQQKKADTNEYLIKYVDFKYNPMKVYSSDDTDTSSTTLYDKTKNDSSYKMYLYSIGFFKGDIVNSKVLGVSGKTLLDSMSTALDECNYSSRMVYNEDRDDDYVVFDDKSIANDTQIMDTFNEGYDGNILGVSNIKYTPITSMVNSNIVSYNKVERNSTNTDEYKRYCHTKTVNLENILRYGECSNLNNSEVISSYVEAKQQSRNDYDNNFKTDMTYTLKVVGLPLCPINSYVTTKMVNDVLSNTLQVNSISIDVDVGTRPMVQTSLGLGEIDNKIKVRKNLEKQRRELIKTALDINQPITYEDNNTLWDD